ncbi:SH3 domain-containing kinase-binding protein 1-like [Phyllobates terribilis]|uniref:SH3 domain-containing kinase-binding protein 1-like n=1 Tax=Phyllobates terribilis TaxID=111132 RepID=UPI003CCB17CF
MQSTEVSYRIGDLSGRDHFTPLTDPALHILLIILFVLAISRHSPEPSCPDFFDSPSPDDDKDDINHLSQRPIDSSKKAPRSLTSQVPENRAALPPKPGGLISSVSFSHGAPGAPSAFHIVTSSSHRSNSPSFGSSDARHTVEHGQSSLEELQAQVKELRSIIETMKDQQKKEIKQLLSELDEEKKIRLRLQMDVNEIKKSLQSK